VTRGIAQASLDGKDLAGARDGIQLMDDGRYHYGEITLG